MHFGRSLLRSATCNGSLTRHSLVLLARYASKAPDLPESNAYPKKQTVTPPPSTQKPLSADSQKPNAPSTASPSPLPPLPTVLDANTTAAEPTEDVGLQVVSYPVKARVMPLPEDREVKEVEVEIPGDASSPPRKVVKKFYVPRQEVRDYDIPLPKLVEVEGKKRMTAVGLDEAIKLVKTNARAKFDETLEMHVVLGIDPKRTDLIVRGAVTLPHGNGKSIKIAVFADGESAEEALAAGADIVGGEDLVERIFASKGKNLEFEKCIATPALMPKLGKVARILGPKGLMPNPKVGTVTTHVGEAVMSAKQGRVDFKADKGAIVHAGLGKVSFPEEKLRENILTFAGAVLAAKPAGLKKSSRYVGFFTKVYLTSTMGSGVPVTVQSIARATDSYMKANAAATQA